MGIRSCAPLCDCGTCQLCKNRERQRRRSEIRKGNRGFYWDLPNSEITETMFEAEVKEVCRILRQRR